MVLDALWVSVWPPPSDTTFTDQGEICSGIEVRPGGVGDVRAVRDDSGAGAARGHHHVAGGTTHRAQAHFAQKVEIVLVEQDQLRVVGQQQALILVDPVGQHGIEERDSMPGFSQHGDHLQGGERRIGFGAQYLLVIEAQVIRMANQDR